MVAVLADPKWRQGAVLCPLVPDASGGACRHDADAENHVKRPVRNRMQGVVGAED